MDEDDGATVEVALPRELLRDIDEYATTHGYENPSALVREALDRQAREETVEPPKQ
jgi:metal-responsive CopG/Arc/MetJ family transcriptional regulator